MVGTGEHPALTTRRARILLKADADGPDAWTDEPIAEALDTNRMTVVRVRQQFAAEGLDVTLHRKKPAGRQYRKLDGAQEAQLVAIACSKAPEARPSGQWSCSPSAWSSRRWSIRSARPPSVVRFKERP